MASDLRCKLCGDSDVRFEFSEEVDGNRYASYHCAKCDVYQTLGEVPSVSPDYVDLTEHDLVGEHVFLQRAHKRPAFEEWLVAVKRLDSGFAAGERRTLLDIGCGVGGFLDFAAENGLDVYGFDASEAQIAVAHGTHPNVRHAISADDYAAQLPHRPAFDFVTMWDVFEHIREPQALLGSVRPFMKPAGLFYVSVPSGAPTRLKLKVAKMRGTEPGLIPWEHVFYYTKKSLASVFRQSGYDVAVIDGVAPYVRPLSFHEAVRRIVHRALRATPMAFQISAFARPAGGVRTPS
jgi:SAM-dependent methyltransferase